MTYRAKRISDTEPGQKSWSSTIRVWPTFGTDLWHSGEEKRSADGEYRNDSHGEGNTCMQQNYAPDHRAA